MSDVKNHSTLPTNLISYWELEEASGTRVDSHGSNDLTDNNTVAQGTGKQGSCADFEEANSEYLSITDASQSGLDISGDWSGAMWIKIEQLPTTASQAFGLMGKYLSTGNKRSYYAMLQYEADGGKAADRIEIGVSGTGTTNPFYAIGSSAAIVVSGDVGNWVHLAWSLDLSAKSLTVWKNGTSVATESRALIGTVSSIYNNDRPFEIGRYNEGSSLYDGLIDEAGIWSKVLTQSEVDHLYNSGSGIPYDAGGGSTFTPKAIFF